MIENAVLLAGPTASGKSRLALRLAEREGRTIVNADAMQNYSVLRVLTARPDETDLARAPHRLYGHVHPSTSYSVGAWLTEVRALAASGAFRERPPIFVGGTGLYFRALCRGLSAMPEIPPATRERWRWRLHEEGADKLHRLLRREDPEAAALIRPTDGQRILRALEVLESSGRSILAWQKESGQPAVDAASARRLVLVPPRPVLAERIDRRFERMVAEGAMDEARALGALDLSPAVPALKAIGVRELLAADRGEWTLAEAVERAKLATRQYAKRQETWFRHQLGPAWHRLAAAEEDAAERATAELSRTADASPSAGGSSGMSAT